MRKILFSYLILCMNGVSAQKADTIFFTSNWREVESGHLYTYKSIRISEEGVFRKEIYTKFNHLYMSGSYSDSTFGIRHGEFIWFDRKDTSVAENYESGKMKSALVYESGKRIEKRVYTNDSTRYVLTIGDGKYITSKKLYVGDLIYDFQGKDSILDLYHLKYAFRKKQPNSDFFILKYKILPWIIGEDVGMNYSLGLEYTFKKVQSVDLVFTYLDWDMDQEDNSGNPLPSIYNVRRSVQLGYRHYFEMFKNKKRTIKYFVSPFVRFSKWQDYYSAGAVTDFYKNETWNYYAGAVFGFCFDMSEDDDGNYSEFFIGPQYYRRDTEQGLTQNNLVIENSNSTYQWGIRFGMNFCGLLQRRRN